MNQCNYGHIIYLQSQVMMKIDFLISTVVVINLNFCYCFLYSEDFIMFFGPFICNVVSETSLFVNLHGHLHKH